MLIDNKFNIGDKVYLETDADQKCRIVTGINIRSTSITYALCSEITESWHYDFEITVEKNHKLAQAFRIKKKLINKVILI